MEHPFLETNGGDPSAEAFDRLKRRVDFQRVGRGRRKAVEAFTLQAAPRSESGDGLTTPRVGFTVTRKVGPAVVRNRIRRRLKEALRAARPLETEGDHDYVLVARRQALARPFAALVEDLRLAFRAIRRIDRERSRAPAEATPKGRDRRP